MAPAVDKVTPTADGALVELSHEDIKSFEIAKKDGTKVVTGPSPLTITGLDAGTQVAKGDYVALAVAGDYKSDTVEIPAFQVQIPTLTPDPFKAGSSRITGTYTGNISKAVGYLNDTKKTAGGDFENGRFSYYIGSGVVKGSKLEIEGLDASNNVLVSKQAIPILD